MMQKNILRSTRFLSVAIAAGALSGCMGNHPAETAGMDAPKMMDDAVVTRAIATVGPSKSATTQPLNNNVTGTVTFTLTDGQLKFVADIDGLAANTEHGFHIHDKGDLSDPDLKSAGGHFNPTKEKHGGPGAAHHHAGDMGNLKSDDKGHAHLEGTLMHATLSGETTILGRSVIIHSKPDDLTSQPAGESGARVAGGVIKAAT